MILRELITLLIIIGVLIIVAASAAFVVTVPCAKDASQPCLTQETKP